MTDDESALFAALEAEVGNDLHSVPMPTYYAVKAIFTSDSSPDQYESRLVPGTLTVSATEAGNSVLFFRNGSEAEVAAAMMLMFRDLALSYDRAWRLWAVCVVKLKVEI